MSRHFCGALNRSAATLALAGRYKASTKASSRALPAAAMADEHADPLVESLATSISAKALARLALSGMAERRLLEWLGLASIVRRFAGGVDRNATLDDIERSLKRCETLRPFQIHHHEVMLNLRFQIAALAWLTTADHRLREIAKATIRIADERTAILAVVATIGFQQTARQLEVFPKPCAISKS